MNDFIKWETLQFKKSSGKEKIRCPKCDTQRTDKKDRSLLVNHKEGYGKCFYCEALTFRDETENKYKEINQNDFKPVLNNSKWIEYINSRKISEETLNKLYITFEQYYQPKHNKKVDNIVFNYYEGSKLVNKKFRSSAKGFTQTAETKPIFYNINSVLGSDEVYIVEGEFDVCAMVEAGYKNTISVPNGANDNDDYWQNSEKYLKHVKKFIIAVDNDDKGIILRDKIAQRLGRYRCRYINFDGKDANDDLISGKLKESVTNEISFPVSGTFTAKDLRDGVNDLYDYGLPKTIYPKGDWFGNLKDIFSVMRGQVVLPTGIPSHGKSTFTDWYVLNLLKDYDMKASWYTPEHSPMDLYETELIQKTLGRNFWRDKNNQRRLTKEDIDVYDKWANEKIYLTDCDGDNKPTWKWLLDKFKEQIYSFGIDIFVIDAFNKVILPKGNKLDEINNVLTELTNFAKANNVIIFLVAHPTKMKKSQETGLYDAPTLYDVSGSSDFRNQVHCGYTIYRHFGEDTYTSFINLKTKYSFQGTIGGTSEFDYCDTNGRLIARDYYNPHFSLLEELKEVNQEYKIPLQQLEDAFETLNLEDDVPF